MRGDGTVPMELARLDGAQHHYVGCDHSDLPLADGVIAGTVELLKTGKTRRFANSPRIPRKMRRRVSDAQLRQELGARGREFVLQTCRWDEVARRTIEAIL